MSNIAIVIRTWLRNNEDGTYTLVTNPEDVVEGDIEQLMQSVYREE